jgi:hypothetical protein
MSYPGGKNGAGVYQTIINHMPPHTTYIEPFLGSGAIMRLKRPARVNIGIDLDPEVMQQWQACIALAVEGGSHHVTHGATAESAPRQPCIGEISHRHSRRACSIARDDDDGRVQFHIGDGIAFLHAYPFTGTELVYCDPPYLPATRRDPALYRFEMDEYQHRSLLGTIRALPCLVLISGYWSALYAESLADWHATTYQAMTRSGFPVTEWLWGNYPTPIALHDYRYLGANFRQRERIKRKTKRWVQRLRTMPVLERQAMLAAMEEAWT